MSSNSLLNMVPVLKGASNWQAWEPLMKVFLMGQGQWFVITVPAVNPEWQKVKETFTDKDGETKERLVKDRTAPPDNIDEYKSWSADNWKALGNINLRLDPAIRYKYSSIEKSANLWVTLKAEFGKPGIAATYHEFKTALSLSLPENSDPSLALNKLFGHFGRMAEADCEIPEHLQCLIVLTKLPSSMDSLAQMICQTDNIMELEPAKILRQVQLAWEQKANRTKGSNGRGGSANKITAVKRPQGKPTFQQQLENNNPGLSCT